MEEIDMIVWVVGAAAGILAGAAVILPPATRAWDKHISPRLVSKSKILSLVQEVSVQVKSLSLEMRPNGGSSFRDVLDRIEHRQMLQGEKQRAVFTTLPVGIFETDERGAVTWSNRKLSRMTGRTPSELRGSGWVNALAYEERSRVISNWSRSVETESEYEDNVIVQTPEGVILPVFIQAMKLESLKGEVLGYVVTVTSTSDDAKSEITH